MGTLLEDPSLLMSKQFVRNTDTKEEVLAKGEAFKKKEIPVPAAPPRVRR